MNALAGGGSFITLPALIATGLPSVAANATSSVALWPGGFASAFVYRRDQRPVAGMAFATMLVLTMAGGAAGALLLLVTPE
ncbi:MAG: sulfite exporter TauE/SafE family protein, partial [Alphaproteobacteria bacterium]